MLKNIISNLNSASRKISRNDAEILLAHAINKPREFVISHPEYKLNPWQWIKFKHYVYKRKQNYPVAYLTEHKEFYGLDFKVSKNVLVPRPETEVMVDEAIDVIENQKEVLLIDIGTGSGCIPVSILKNTKVEKAIATDISKKALNIAKENAEKHNVKIDFKVGSLLEPVKKEVEKWQNIVVIANLPYVTQEQFNSESSIQQEPKQALIAKSEGLEYYENLLKQLSEVGIGDKKITIFFEIDPNQSDKIKKLIRKYLPNSQAKVKKDLKDYDRLIKINLLTN